MTPDLTMLIWVIALAFVQILVAAAGSQSQVGLGTLAGNRENLPARTGWAGRAQRAYQNMLETLPLFIGLVLVAHLAGKVNGTVMLGIHVYFWGRVAHGVIYVLGLPWVRTLAWVVSVVGMVLIFLQLV